MISAEKASSISQEERLEFAKSLVSKKVEAIIDRGIISSVCRRKDRVELIIGNKEDVSEDIKDYLGILGYQEVQASAKYERPEDELGEYMISVGFKVPRGSF